MIALQAQTNPKPQSFVHWSKKNKKWVKTQKKGKKCPWQHLVDCLHSRSEGSRTRSRSRRHSCGRSVRFRPSIFYICVVDRYSLGLEENWSPFWAKVVTKSKQSIDQSLVTIETATVRLMVVVSGLVFVVTETIVARRPLRLRLVWTGQQNTQCVAGDTGRYRGRPHRAIAGATGVGPIGR